MERVGSHTTKAFSDIPNIFNIPDIPTIPEIPIIIQIN